MFAMVNEIKGVLRSGASSQQGGDTEVNFKILYQTGPMKKTSEVDAILLEKKTMADKLKSIKEVMDVQD